MPPTRKDSWNTDASTITPMPSLGGNINPTRNRIKPREKPAKGPAAATFKRSSRFSTMFLILVIAPKEPICHLKHVHQMSTKPKIPAERRFLFIFIFKENIASSPANLEQRKEHQALSLSCLRLQCVLIHVLQGQERSQELLVSRLSTAQGCQTPICNQIHRWEETVYFSQALHVPEKTWYKLFLQ